MRGPLVDQPAPPVPPPQSKPSLTCFTALGDFARGLATLSRVLGREGELFPPGF